MKENKILKITSYLSLILGVLFALVLFGLMVFGLYHAILDKEYGVSLGIIGTMFVFVYMMAKVPIVKNFGVGGKHLGITVNKNNCVIQTTEQTQVSKGDEI